MEKEIRDFIGQRCGKALAENEEYKAAERSGNVPCDMLQVMAEEICYLQGRIDAINDMKLSRNC